MEQGICPVCNEYLVDYTERYEDGETCFYKWTCSHCGAKGKEVYNMVFVGHEEIDEGIGGK